MRFFGEFLRFFTLKLIVGIKFAIRKLLKSS